MLAFFNLSSERQKKGGIGVSYQTVFTHINIFPYWSHSSFEKKKNTGKQKQLKAQGLLLYVYSN